MPEETIYYIDRVSRQRCVETVFGERFIRLLYGKGVASQWLGVPLRHLASRSPLFSMLMGWYQGLEMTRRNIRPFIKTHGIDPGEFLKEVDQFTSFADFFCRKLKPEARPITPDSDVAVIPTDGRFYFFEDVSRIGPFDIKGHSFDIVKLLQDEGLAKRYEQASMVLGRLCPSDYHRFHFAAEGVPSASKLIDGYLYSVNPLAVRQNVCTFWENKRTISVLKSPQFGEVLTIEIGATSVGSINQTYEADRFQAKGAEKGYFAFGGSAIALLFPKGRIAFDADLLAATKQNIEMRCLLGQSMGRAQPIIPRTV